MPATLIIYISFCGIAVSIPTITKIFNNENGGEKTSIELLNYPEEQNFQLRRKIEERLQNDDPLYACALCGQPLVLRSNKYQKLGRHTFYFKHEYDSGDCPIKTANKYSREELQAMKYNGAKESKAHLESKLYLASMLKRDPRFTDIKVEEVIRGKGWSKKWKKPDIAAVFQGRQVVFEVQLSTTFLDVIVSREIFYRDEGIAIFWVFRNLNPVHARATEKDVFFNNKSNALSLDEESMTATTESGELTFTGHFKEPVLLSDTSISEHWQTMPVTFDLIKFDGETGKPYFRVFESAYKQVVEQQKHVRFAGPLENLTNLVLEDMPRENDFVECCSKLRELGIYSEPGMTHKFSKLLMALISIRDGTVYFENQNGKWTWLVNYVWQHHIHYWVVLLYVVADYNRTELVFDDNNYKLTEKRKRFQSTWRTDATLKQSTEHYPLFLALFPKIENSLKAFKKKLEQNPTDS